MIHVAVKRGEYYYHHYVILANESVWNSYFKVVHYTAGSLHLSLGSTCGAVEKDQIQLSTVIKEISEGMYVISGTNYPKNAKDFDEAFSRYKDRCGERAYHVTYNNCEHMANYIMNGKPESEQIKNSSSWKKVFADTFDMLVSDGKENFVKTVIDSLGGTAAFKKFVLSACEKVFFAASQIAKSDHSKILDISSLAKQIICMTADYFSECCSAEQMLCSETCCEVAETAAKNVLKQTVVATGVITVGVETVFAAWQIYNLWKMRNAEKIQNRDFIRETTKTVVTVPVASSLTVIGTVIGHAICPMPVVGIFFGALAGNIIGRLGAGYVTGGIFDWFWP